MAASQYCTSIPSCRYICYVCHSRTCDDGVLVRSARFARLVLASMVQASYASSGWPASQPDPTILAAYNAALESLRSRPPFPTGPQSSGPGTASNAAGNGTQLYPGQLPQGATLKHCSTANQVWYQDAGAPFHADAEEVQIGPDARLDMPRRDARAGSICATLLHRADSWHPACYAKRPSGGQATACCRPGGVCQLQRRRQQLWPPAAGAGGRAAGSAGPSAVCASSDLCSGQPGTPL